ncbi:endonuclease exonuclease phosphatase family protein [Cystoisospora suis]|uniref:Endonuclease exonuclease phosphatase family protein n=1 Tax=Cystoisospora suis TaxID=483139 RepID=A0A2C6KMW2_9APIC|nr:endonuclease exonuclease phosphatase family protein [Cystoisospora suis]
MENGVPSSSPRQCFSDHATAERVGLRNALLQSNCTTCPSPEMVGIPSSVYDFCPASWGHLPGSPSAPSLESHDDPSWHQHSVVGYHQSSLEVSSSGRTTENIYNLSSAGGRAEERDPSCSALKQKSGSVGCRGRKASRSNVSLSFRRGRFQSDEFPSRTSVQPRVMTASCSHESLSQSAGQASADFPFFPSLRRYSKRSSYSLRSKSLPPLRVFGAQPDSGGACLVDNPTSHERRVVSGVCTPRQRRRRLSAGSGFSSHVEHGEETCVFYDCGNPGVPSLQRPFSRLSEDRSDFQECDDLLPISSSFSSVQFRSGVPTPDSFHISLHSRTDVRSFVTSSTIRTEERAELSTKLGDGLSQETSRRRGSLCKGRRGDRSSFSRPSEACSSVPILSPQDVCSKLSSHLKTHNVSCSSSSSLRCSPYISPACTPIAPSSPCVSSSSSTSCCSSRAVEVSHLPRLFHAVPVHASPPVPEAPADAGRDALVYPSYSRTSTTSLASSVSAHPPPPLDAAALEPTETDTAAVDTLNIVSFNAGLLEYRLCGLQIYQNPPFTRRRLSHIPVSLLDTKSDIICLQEVYDDVHADFLVDSMRHVFPYVGRRTSGGRFALHNGLMVLSRFPILHTRFHPFHDVTYIERLFGSKGMLECSIDIPGVGVAAVFNIHLASGAVDPESPYVEALRSAEILQVLSACEDAGQRGEVPIVVGDLNAAPDLCASNYKSFVERGWRDCWLLVHGNREALLKHHLVHQEQMLLQQDLDPEDLAERQKAVQLELAHLLQQHKIQRKLLDDAAGVHNNTQHGDYEEGKRKKNGKGAKGGVGVVENDKRVSESKAGLDTARKYLYGDKGRTGGGQGGDQGEDHDGYYFALSPTDYALGKRQMSGLQGCLLGGDTRDITEDGPNTTKQPRDFATTSSHISPNFGEETPLSSCQTAGVHMIGKKNSGVDYHQHVVVELADLQGANQSKERLTNGSSPGRSKLNGGGGGGRGGTEGFSLQDQKNLVDLEAGTKAGGLGGGINNTRNDSNGGVCTPGKTGNKNNSTTEGDEEQRQQLLLSEALLATTSKVQQKVAWHQQSLEARRDGRNPWAPGIGGAAINAAAEDSEATTTDDAEEWLLRKKSENYGRGVSASSFTNGSGLQPRLGGLRGRGGCHSSSSSSSTHCRRRTSSLLPGLRGEEDLYESGGLLVKQDEDDVDNDLDDGGDECDDENDWSEREDFTWDPQNPLNSIGPHAGCHGLRCDYVFLPPQRLARGLREFVPVSGEILLREPRVMVDACCFGCLGQVMLVTLSDHYAFKVTLQRSSFDHSLTAIHSPSMVLALKEANLFCGLPGIPLDDDEDEEEDEACNNKGKADENAINGEHISRHSDDDDEDDDQKMKKSKQKDGGSGREGEGGNSSSGSTGKTTNLLLDEEELQETKKEKDNQGKKETTMHTTPSDQIL